MKDTWKFVASTATVVAAVVGGVVAMGVDNRALRDDMREDFNQVFGQFQAVNGKFDAVNGRFDAVSGRFDAVYGKIDAVRVELSDDIQTMREELGGGIERLESLHMSGH